MGRFYRPVKQSVTIRLDADVLAWLKQGGKGYQTRVNRKLRTVMEQQRKTTAASRPLRDRRRFRIPPEALVVDARS